MWFTQGDNGSGPGHSEPVDHAIGRSRGGPTTKIHLACDGHGRPLTVVLTAGNVNDCTMFTQVPAGIWMPKPGRGQSWERPRRVLADKGYSTRAIRAHLRSRGIRQNRHYRTFEPTLDLAPNLDLFTAHPAARSWLKTVRTECAMQWYARWFGDWSDYWGDYTWQPLGGSHTALADCRTVLDRLHAMACAASEPAPIRE